MTADDTSANARRREFLKAVSAVGLAAWGSAAAGAQETTAAPPDETIVLGGEVEYWYGVAPGDVQGQENPSLTFQSGTRYRVVWINLDGVDHDFVIEDGDDDDIVASETASEVGSTQSVTFTASEEMDEYYCRFHPDSMRGDVEFGDGTST